MTSSIGMIHDSSGLKFAWKQPPAKRSFLLGNQRVSCGGRGPVDTIYTTYTFTWSLNGIINFIKFQYLLGNFCLDRDLASCNRAKSLNNPSRCDLSGSLFLVPSLKLTAKALKIGIPNRKGSYSNIHF